ncbi:hypothetical protein M0R89_09235 [Halorussus limi]|uniref:Uncharacterized protein n=1 Tax=Halorussus limi TaxID=2938695 RepID=A0A8U0HPE1_9EURY|nr:hypothetical protein [Halorussus limi]UPV72731.1 hypothetical protein M0R89_09235 [Halorussus limi]
MVRKSVTIREDQAAFVEDTHLNFSSWARDKIKTWYEEGEEFPSSRKKRQAPMERKAIRIGENLDEFLYEERVNLSHFLQDRLDERMELERKLGGE